MEFKMIIHVSQVFNTEEEAAEMYEEVAGELRNHQGLHVNGQVVRKYTGYSPENPNGHEVPV